MAEDMKDTCGCVSDTESESSEIDGQAVQAVQLARASRDSIFSDRTTTAEAQN